jgi:NADH:ubiquinone oxidoreductase subunit 6 (subunit J)
MLVALAAALASGTLPPSATSFDLGVAAVGNSLFGPLVVAFELTAPLLLVAIVGAVVIWRRHEPRSTTAPRVLETEPRRLVMHR